MRAMPDVVNTVALLRCCLWVAVVLGVTWAGGCGRKAAAPSQGTALESGWMAYRLGEFTLAHRRFTEAFESEQSVAAALYALGINWQLRRPGEDLKRAAEMFERVVAEHAQSEEAAWSLLALARMAHTPPADQPLDVERVLAAYQRVIDHDPEHAAAMEALLLQQSLILEGATAEHGARVVARLEPMLAKVAAGGPFRGDLRALLAQAYRWVDQPERSLEQMIAGWKERELDPRNPEPDDSWTYWNIATLAMFEAGDFATARGFFRRLIEEYPTDQKVYLARQQLAKMDAIEAELRSDGAGVREGP